MTSTPEPSVQPLEPDFPTLLADVTGPDAREPTASPVELTLFRRLLALGAARLRWFVVTRAAGRPSAPLLAADGTRLGYHEQRPTTDDAVVGNGRWWRQYAPALGHDGLWPLDAAVRLPGRCDADL
jgi:hypothetical protein